MDDLFNQLALIAVVCVAAFVFFNAIWIAIGL